MSKIVVKLLVSSVILIGVTFWTLFDAPEVKLVGIILFGFGLMAVATLELKGYND